MIPGILYVKNLKDSINIQDKMKSIIKIPIQSFGDIITNSSSETFCTITSDEKLDEIYNALKAIIGEDGYSEDNISFHRETDEETNEEYIRIDIPYDVLDYSDLIGAGIEAILDKRFKGKYIIKIEL